MKKIISLILALALTLGVCLSLASCDGLDSILEMIGMGSAEGALDGTETNPQDNPAPTKIQIGVQAGTTGEYFVNGDADWGFDGIKGYEAKGYQNAGLAVSDMLNGNVKYVVVDQQPALQLAGNEAFTGAIKVVNIPLTVEEYAFGVDKAQDDLLASINAILADMKTSGKLNEIVTKYATGEGIAPVESAEFDASKADKQLVVATNANFAPFEYKEGDQFAGIDIEIMVYVADKLGLELVIMDMDFEAVISAVGKNNVDMAVSGLTVTEKRKESVNFTDTYYNAAQMLIVKDTETAFDACKTDADVLAVLADFAAKAE